MSAVYFAKAGDYVKIGFASNPTHRVRSLLKAGSKIIVPEDIDRTIEPSCILVIPFCRMRDERNLHLLFGNHWVVGEWYRWSAAFEHQMRTMQFVTEDVRRKDLRRARAALGLAGLPPAKETHWGLQTQDLLADLQDPPWRYDNGTPGREIERHYPTMTHEEICALDVPSARNAVLYLWGVAPKLPEALEVMSSWGFTYRTGAVWDKELVGMGYWFRGQHEHLLVGVKGNWSPPPQPLRVSSVYRSARGRHSKKPDVVRQQIATWWPDARRLEMFCRYPSPGWHVWGNQVDSSVADMPFERFDPHADPAQDALFGAAS